MSQKSDVRPEPEPEPDNEPELECEPNLSNAELNKRVDQTAADAECGKGNSLESEEDDSPSVDLVVGAFFGDDY